MRCRYCNIALAPLRSIADGEFCCDQHRNAFQQQPAAVPETPVAPAEPEVVSPALRMLRLKFPLQPAAVPETVPDVAPPEASAEIGFSSAPELPVREETLKPPSEDVEPATPRPPSTPAFWQWIRATWRGAPRDLKLVTVALPVVAALAIAVSFPKTPIQAGAPAEMTQISKLVNERWKDLNETISSRAAISYADDFRSGLDAWESRANRTTNWSYDAAGFVRPGPLAIFKPTLDLVDYRFEFLGAIDQKAMGWVFRAEDLKNYYAMKFVVVKPGPLPLIDMVRYAVINGQEGPHVHKPLPMTARSDMLYRVLVDVRGADFTVMAQDQVVDFWTDHRLQHGGVGFFASRGERSRLRWVEVSHQYDALGRVCAYLAPYGIEGRNGTFN